MPTYHYYCSTCDDDGFVWESIHADARTTGDCGHGIIRVIDNVVTLHVGRSGQEAIVADNREKRWDKDMPAYKRFRQKGHQPPRIDGCDALEATAKSDIEIKSGGRLKYSDARVAEGKEMAADIMKGRI